ncbi:MAG: HipA domain-containing protein [Deltaproteobacteria bacterium]|jgi:serine/threonine-protein kinase HipA|nr:HipA domain-containing protein [Deltaproteobacteria bacterium]
MENLIVIWGGKTVGRLHRPPMSGELNFSYDPQWISCGRPGISLSLPVSGQRFDTEITKNFFGNYMPENSFLLEYLRAKHRITPGNLFAFLAEYGIESAGALVIVKEGMDIPECSNEYRDVTDRLVAELTLPPEKQIDLIIAVEAKISLAGAQNKLPVRYEKGRFLVPADESLAATTHVIKPPHRAFRDLPYNEAFCMELARSIGLPAAMSDIVDIGGTGVFITERYDRTVADGTVTRLHQEDFCQALGVHHDFKYEVQGGPGFRECVSLLASNGLPRSATDDLASVAVFNVIIANHDAHAKNFSLLYDYRPEPDRSGTGLRLAPFYDLVCTGIYPLNDSFAMSIGDIFYLHELDDDAYRRFASDLSLTCGQLAELIRDTVSGVRASALDIVHNFVTRFGREGMFSEMLQLTMKNCEILEKASESLDHAHEFDP